METAQGESKNCSGALPVLYQAGGFGGRLVIYQRIPCRNNSQLRVVGRDASGRRSTQHLH